ncbi:MAG TPA: MarR family transcriptional regulator [Alphaproteobacteria bacterium]|nr:MarR family transcriptional regulator [Alphaproteobacteria bacterium]
MPTHYQGEPEEVRALDALVKLTRAADAVNRRLDGLLAEAHLTTSQFGVLEALLHLGQLCQKDLAAKLLKSDGNLTMVLGNLEKRGLVTRTRDPQDKRLLNVQLTVAGRRLIRSLFPRHAANVASAFAALTPAEQETLGKLTKKLGLAQADA